MIKKILTATLFISLTAINSFSQDIKVLMNKTIENNYSVKIAEYEKDKAFELYKEATLGKFPDLSIEKSRTDFNEPMATPALADKKYELDKFVAQAVLFAGGKLENKKNIMGLSFEISKLNLELKKEEAVIRSIEQYYGIKKLEKLIDVTEEALKILQEHYSNVQDYVKTGIALDSDLLKVKVRISETEKQNVDLNNQKALLIASFEKNARIKYSDISITEGKKDYSVKELEDILKKAEKRLEYNIFKIKDKIASCSVKIAKGEYLPVIGVKHENYSGTEMNENNPGHSLTVFASWKLYDFGKSNSLLNAEKINKKITEIELKDTFEDLKLDIKNNFYNLKSSTAKEKIGQDQVKTSKRNLEIMEAQYKEGVITNVDFLDAQLEFTKAKVDLNTSIYDKIVNYYKLKKACGDLLEEQI